MSPLEAHRDVIADASAAIGALPGNGPLFHAPWQTRIFALIVALVKAGHVPWTTFQTRLVQAVTDAGGANGDAAEIEAQYFDCWLIAAEETLLSEGFLSAQDVTDQIDEITVAVRAIRESQISDHAKHRNG